MDFVRMSSKGQIVLPRDIRRKFGLKTGDRFMLVSDGENIVLMRPNPKDMARAFEKWKSVKKTGARKSENNILERMFKW